MSDLISREKNGKPFEGTAYELGLKIMRYIDAMDSDYDVEKIVEELKKRSKEYNSGVRLHGKPEEMLTDNAIEIVKQSGLSDDVCEWNGEQSRLVTFTRFTTDCGDNIDLQTNSELLKAFRYCPFCGKKIKVTE